MSYVASFLNAKGGVGKSTLSVEAAVCMADQGFKVHHVDGDDQYTSYTWLQQIESSVVSTRLTETEPTKRTTELKTILTQAEQDDADVIIIDTKGDTGLVTSAATIRSELAIVPLQPSGNDIWELERTLSIAAVSQDARGGLPEVVVVLNLTSDIDPLMKEIQTLAEARSLRVAKTNVKRLNFYRDAPLNSTVSTRLTDTRGKLAGDRIRSLVTELFGPVLEAKRGVLNG